MARQDFSRSDTAGNDQAVHIDFEYGRGDWSQFWNFETTLKGVVESSGLGKYDGNELALDGSVGTLFLYGPDADQLLDLVRPYLEAATFAKNAVATVVYGPEDKEGVRVVTVRLTPPT